MFFIIVIKVWKNNFLLNCSKLFILLIKYLKYFIQIENYYINKKPHLKVENRIDKYFLSKFLQMFVSV